VIITYGQAKRQLAKYAGKAGKCVDDADVDLFIKSVIEELLNRGANGNLRKWQFYSQNGTITAPPDLLLPIKVKVEGPCGTTQGNVYDKFYEFYDQSSLDVCTPWEKGAVEEPNTFFTQFNIPTCGAHIMACPRCNEEEGSNLILQGTRKGGEDIWGVHKGENFKGEYLSICKAQTKYTSQRFYSITGIQKSVTKDYVRLYWYNPKTGEKG